MNSVDEMMEGWDGKDKDCCILPKHPKPKKILLECGTCPQDAIFEIRKGRVRRYQEYALDRVLVDTTCLCKPQVKIEFSSIVSFEAKTRRKRYRSTPKPCAKVGSKCRCPEKEVEVNLEFELIRVCNGVEECVRKWNYKKEFEFKYIREFEVGISEPFTVTYCDRECPGCCFYKMIVKGKGFKGRFKSLKVVTPNISALAQGICGD